MRTIEDLYFDILRDRAVTYNVVRLTWEEGETIKKYLEQIGEPLEVIRIGDSRFYHSRFQDLVLDIEEPEQ